MVKLISGLIYVTFLATVIFSLFRGPYNELRMNKTEIEEGMMDLDGRNMLNCFKPNLHFLLSLQTCQMKCSKVDSQVSSFADSLDGPQSNQSS